MAPGTSRRHLRAGSDLLGPLGELGAGVKPTELGQAVLMAELRIGSDRAKDLYHALRTGSSEN